MGGGEGMQEMCSHINNNEGGKMEGGATKPRDGAIGHPNLGTLPPPQNTHLDSAPQASTSLPPSRA